MFIEPFEIPKFPGFWSEELFRPNQIKLKTLQLMEFNTRKGILYKVALFPISGKELEIEPLSLKFKNKKEKRRGRDPFFDPFFDSFFTETETKILRSKKREIFIKIILSLGLLVLLEQWEISKSLQQQILIQ